jgi:tRNA threonylcarbamoyladenosine modification (KEOPS) complex  Pcc1 subunit
VLGALQARLAELEDSLRRGVDRSVFGKIFAVNNEIGRAVREHPSLRGPLLDLQSNVNAITLSLKAGDVALAEGALEASLRSFSRMKEGRGPPKKIL